MGRTFMPDGSWAHFEELQERVERKRFTTFATVSMELNALAPRACASTGFIDSALEVMAAPAEYRRPLVADPAFLVWVNLAIAAANGILTGSAPDRRALHRTLAEFRPMRVRSDARRRPGAALRVPGTDILVQRFDIDPLVARATPPSYRFTGSSARRRALSRSGYPLEFFADVATLAFDRIHRTWPDCHRQLASLVRVLGYVPDASFRSCSASRYVGAMYLAARDSSVLDLEESLVHEGGHQLLYTIVEAGQVVRPDAADDDGGGPPAQYRLPWSGQVRDFYGYFHAFFIYILLAKYFDRVVAAAGDAHTSGERDRARERRDFILKGLAEAVPDFEGNPGFAPDGRELFASLRTEVDRMVAAAGVSGPVTPAAAGAAVE